jgi:hypothetical protein
MNIKIKHFQKKTPYSSSGKNKLLAALGLMASLGVSGCGITEQPLSGDPAMPESSSSTGLIEMPGSSSSEGPPLAGEITLPESSSSTEAPVGGVIAVPESSSSGDVIVKLDTIQPISGSIIYVKESSSSTSSSSSSDVIIEIVQPLPLSGVIQIEMPESSSSVETPIPMGGVPIDSIVPIDVIEPINTEEP